MQVWGFLLVSLFSGSILGHSMDGWQRVARADIDSILARTIKATVVESLPKVGKRAGKIDQWTEIEKEQSLPLASNQEITVDEVQAQSSMSVPQLTAEISRDLDTVGAMVAEDAATEGSRVKESPRGNVIVRWYTYTGPKVELTSTEAQAIIFAIYRHMAKTQAGFCRVNLSTSHSSITYQVTVQIAAVR